VEGSCEGGDERLDSIKREVCVDPLNDRQPLHGVTFLFSGCPQTRNVGAVGKTGTL
jgi:hypothetical protein